MPHDMGPVRPHCMRSPRAGCLQEKSKQPPKRQQPCRKLYIYIQKQRKNKQHLKNVHRTLYPAAKDFSLCLMTWDLSGLNVCLGSMHWLSTGQVQTTTKRTATLQKAMYINTGNIYRQQLKNNFHWTLSSSQGIVTLFVDTPADLHKGT